MSDWVVLATVVAWAVTSYLTTFYSSSVHPKMRIFVQDQASDPASSP